jgi:hypothetical protein
MIQFIHGNTGNALHPRGRGATSPRFAGSGDTTGVVNEESDQKRAIPLVECKRGGLKREPEAEMRRPRRSGTGRQKFDDSRDNLPIILRDRAGGSSRPRGGLRIGRRLAATATDGSMTPATGRLDRNHRIREKRGLRQQKRQSEQWREYNPGNFHPSRHLAIRLYQS